MTETVFLLSVAAVFLLGALGEIIFQKTNIPDVIWLIVAGVVMGPVLGLLTQDTLRNIAPYFAAITLVVVLFDGGSALRLKELARAAPRSALLALLSFAFSVVAVAGATMMAKGWGVMPEAWSWSHAFLTGIIVGGSSSIIIMPALMLAKIEAGVSNLISLESALTDAFCVVGTMALVNVMAPSAGGAEAVSPGITLLKSFGIGMGVGLVAGFFWLLFLRFLKSSEHGYPITISALLILYVIINHLGGSAALGILATAIVLGNAPTIGKGIGLVEDVSLDANVKGFHRQVTFMVKSFFFVFIGAMLGPPWALLAVGGALAFILFVARIPAVRLATIGSPLDEPRKNLATISIPRGMAAGVLATIPMSAGIPGTESLPVIIFSCVIGSILLFAMLFPAVSKQVMSRSSELPADVPIAARHIIMQVTPAALTASSGAPALPPSPQPPNETGVHAGPMEEAKTVPRDSG